MITSIPETSVKIEGAVGGWIVTNNTAWDHSPRVFTKWEDLIAYIANCLTANAP